MNRLRVLLVDDDADLVRSWIRCLEIDYHVATAANLTEARARLGDATFDVVLIDQRLGPERGSDLLADLDPSVACVVVSGLFDEADEALVTGRADRTHAKGSPLWCLREAIDQAHERRNANLRVAIRTFVQAEGLSVNVIPFLEHMVRGLDYGEIAAAIGCAKGTVKNRARELLHKTRSRNRQELTTRILAVPTPVSEPRKSS